MKRIEYSFVILPPETHHLSLDWPLNKFKVWFQSVVSGIEEFKSQNQLCLIKYRSSNQKLFFPVSTTSEIIEEDGASFLKYCAKNTIVIGPLGTACIEALIKDIRYFPYDPLPYPSKNIAYYNKLNEILYASKTKYELIENIKSNLIFRKGYSRKNLLYEDGLNLNQIVNLILKDF